MHKISEPEYVIHFRDSVNIKEISDIVKLEGFVEGNEPHYEKGLHFVNTTQHQKTGILINYGINTQTSKTSLHIKPELGETNNRSINLIRNILKKLSEKFDVEIRTYYDSQILSREKLEEDLKNWERIISQINNDQQ